MQKTEDADKIASILDQIAALKKEADEADTGSSRIRERDGKFETVNQATIDDDVDRSKAVLGEIEKSKIADSAMTGAINSVKTVRDAIESGTNSRRDRQALQVHLDTAKKQLELGSNVGMPPKKAQAYDDAKEKITKQIVEFEDTVANGTDAKGQGADFIDAMKAKAGGLLLGKLTGFNPIVAQAFESFQQYRDVKQSKAKEAENNLRQTRREQISNLEGSATKIKGGDATIEVPDDDVSSVSSSAETSSSSDGGDEKINQLVIINAEMLDIMKMTEDHAEESLALAEKTAIKADELRLEELRRKGDAAAVVERDDSDLVDALTDLNDGSLLDTAANFAELGGGLAMMLGGKGGKGGKAGMIGKLLGKSKIGKLLMAGGSMLGMGGMIGGMFGGGDDIQNDQPNMNASTMPRTRKKERFGRTKSLGRTLTGGSGKIGSMVRGIGLPMLLADQLLRATGSAFQAFQSTEGKDFSTRMATTVRAFGDSFLSIIGLSGQDISDALFKMGDFIADTFHSIGEWWEKFSLLGMMKDAMVGWVKMNMKIGKMLFGYVKDAIVTVGNQILSYFGTSGDELGIAVSEWLTKIIDWFKNFNVMDTIKSLAGFGTSPDTARINKDAADATTANDTAKAAFSVGTLGFGDDIHIRDPEQLKLIDPQSLRVVYKSTEATDDTKKAILSELERRDLPLISIVERPSTQANGNAGSQVQRPVSPSEIAPMPTSAAKVAEATSANDMNRAEDMTASSTPPMAPVNIQNTNTNNTVMSKSVPVTTPTRVVYQ